MRWNLFPAVRQVFSIMISNYSCGYICLPSLYNFIARTGQDSAAILIVSSSVESGSITYAFPSSSSSWKTPGATATHGAAPMQSLRSTTIFIAGVADVEPSEKSPNCTGTTAMGFWVKCGGILT